MASESRSSTLLCLVLGLSVGWSGVVLAQGEQSGLGRVLLSAEARQVAQNIGVAKLLDGASSGRDLDSAGAVKALLVRQQITERVLGASLAIDGVDAVIDYEIEQNKSVRSGLEEKRDHAQNLINIASFVTSGASGVMSSALQFKSSTANIGNAIGIAGGGASVALSIVGLRKQAGGRQSLEESPRMLAAFFGRPPRAEERIVSEYPEVVWKYLNSDAPDHRVSRKEELIEKWRREGYIEGGGSGGSQRPNSEAAMGEFSHLRMLSIDEMNDRNSMLRDIRAQVSLMKQNLSEILMNLSVVHPIEVDDLRVEESVPKEPVRKGSVEVERPDAMALPF
jgi:hypothetical protein